MPVQSGWLRAQNRAGSWRPGRQPVVDPREPAHRAASTQKRANPLGQCPRRPVRAAVRRRESWWSCCLLKGFFAGDPDVLFHPAAGEFVALGGSREIAVRHQQLEKRTAPTVVAVEVVT